MTSNTDHIRNRFTNLYIISCILIILIIFLLFFNNLPALLYEPKITPQEWCQIQPCIEVRLFSFSFIIVQPSSTILVYALGGLTIITGIYFLKRDQNQLSIQWWGVSMLFWGLGAIFAGTSYQIFSYELKCAGRDYCLWTSWWEIVYLLLTVGAVNAIMMAQAYSCATGNLRKAIKLYAGVNSCVYLTLIVIGTLVPVRFLISFELLVLFLLPTTLFFFVLNSGRYFRTPNKMDRALALLVLALGIIIGLYYSYYVLGITEILWEQGIWFSENDVLHMGLILWIISILRIIPKYVRDRD